MIGPLYKRLGVGEWVCGCGCPHSINAHGKDGCAVCSCEASYGRERADAETVAKFLLGEQSGEPRARVTVYGHPYRLDGVVDWPIESEFETTGGMHPAKANRQKAEGACFFVFPLDYSGLDDCFPRAHYQHLMIAHNFDWKIRRGEYIHIPFGGKIEIEAV